MWTSRTPSRLLTLGILAAATAGLSPALTPTGFGQDPAPDEVAAPKVPAKLKSWPKPEKTQELKDQIARLRQTRDKGVAVEAQASLEKMGAATAPLLIRALGREEDKKALARVRTVLVAVLDQRHTRLVAESFSDKSEEVRCWALRQVSRTPDETLQPQVLKIWKKLEARGDKVSARELYSAGLCLLSVGDMSGLDAIFEETIANWKGHREELQVVLGAVRGEDLSRTLVKRLEGGDRKQKSAALRLISAGGTRSALGAVAPFLDNYDAGLRVDAINVCRVLVDGDPPLDKLPVFEAIERAKAWKVRL